MYLMYVDESGDPGRSDGSSEHYILSGLVFNSNEWYNNLDRLRKFRKMLFEKYSLRLNTEIHAMELVRIKKIVEYRKIAKSSRLRILNEYALNLKDIFPTASIINISFKKVDFPTSANVAELAWRSLISVYDSFLCTTVNDVGIIIADEGYEQAIRLLVRKMRSDIPIRSNHYNRYIKKVTRIIEDTTHRRSKASYFIQTADVISFLLYKKEFPKGATKKYNLDLLFDLMTPMLFREFGGTEPPTIIRQ